jgi:hypothetical protein
MNLRPLRWTIGGAAALVSAPALALPPALVATNLAGVYAFAAAPAGFDAFAAAPEVLAQFGYPPRPSPGAGRAYDMWARAVRAERTRIVPILRQTDLAAGAALHPRRGLRGGTGTSKNWSAAVIANNASHYGTGSFHSVAAWFNVPAANQAVGACTGGWDHLFSWAGLDGWWNDEVFQAGTASDAYCAGGTTQQFYTAWYEWYPSLSVEITNLPVTAGDAMVVWLIASNDTSGTAWVVNVTSGVSVDVNFSAPAGTVLVGNSAEWVQERPYESGVLATLTNYGAAWMSTAGATLLGSNTVYTMGNPGNATPLLVTMLDNNGAAISFPSELGGNATAFEVEGSAK